MKMKFKIKFMDDNWETEPVNFEDLLYENDIEFRNKEDTVSLPLNDFRFYYTKNDGNHEIIILDD